MERYIEICCIAKVFEIKLESLVKNSGLKTC